MKKKGILHSELARIVPAGHGDILGTWATHCSRCDTDSGRFWKNQNVIVAGEMEKVSESMYRQVEAAGTFH